MRSRPNANGLRTIQFHRGNPESTAGNGGDNSELRKDSQNENFDKKSDDDNSLPNELETGEGDKNCTPADVISTQ